jgi:hypothetical protein
MTTPRIRALVSVAATVISTLGLGACVPAASRAALEQPSPVESGSPAFRFDNDGREHVDVYLVSVRREWLLGRVQPGAIAVLHIPYEALDEDLGPVRLAVLSGGRRTTRVIAEPRAELTLSQPVSAIVAQRWQFAGSQLMSLGLRVPASSVTRD